MEDKLEEVDKILKVLSESGLKEKVTAVQSVLLRNGVVISGLYSLHPIVLLYSPIYLVAIIEVRENQQKLESLEGNKEKQTEAILERNAVLLQELNNNLNEVSSQSLFLFIIRSAFLQLI